MTRLIRSTEYDILRHLAVEAHRQSTTIAWAMTIGLKDEEIKTMLDRLTELLEFMMKK